MRNRATKPRRPDDHERIRQYFLVDIGGPIGGLLLDGCVPAASNKDLADTFDERHFVGYVHSTYNWNRTLARVWNHNSRYPTHRGQRCHAGIRRDNSGFQAQTRLARGPQNDYVPALRDQAFRALNENASEVAHSSDLVRPVNRFGAHT